MASGYLYGTINRDMEQEWNKNFEIPIDMVGK